MEENKDGESQVPDTIELDIDTFESETGTDDGQGNGDGGQQQQPEPVVKKYNVDRFKEYDPDINEDNFEERIEQTFKRAKNLEVVAGGRDLIEKDPDISAWSGHLRKEPKELFIMDEAIRNMESGLPEAEAVKKATEKYDRWATERPDDIEDRVRGVKQNLNSFISKKSKDIISAQEEARKNISTTTKSSKDLVDLTVSEVAKLDSILGMKLSSKDSEKLKRITSQTEKFITSGELDKVLADPKNRAKIAQFLTHEKLYESNVRSLGGGKAKVLDKMANKGEGGAKPKPDSFTPPKEVRAEKMAKFK